VTEWEIGEHGQVAPEEAAVVALPVHRIEVGEIGRTATMPKASGTSRRFTRSPMYWPGDRWRGEPNGGARDEEHQRHEEFAEERRDRHDARVRRPFTTLPAFTVKIVAVCMKTSIITASVRSQSMSWRR